LLEQVEQEVTEGGDDHLHAWTHTFELGDDRVDKTQCLLSPGLTGLDLDIGVEAGGVHEVNEIPQGRDRLSPELR